MRFYFKQKWDIILCLPYREQWPTESYSCGCVGGCVGTYVTYKFCYTTHRGVHFLHSLYDLPSIREEEKNQLQVLLMNEVFLLNVRLFSRFSYVKIPQKAATTQRRSIYLKSCLYLLICWYTTTYWHMCSVLPVHVFPKVQVNCKTKL